MANISIQQARARFKILPPNLQNLLFSVQVAETINRVAEQNHISAEKLRAVAEAAGLVLEGFIHPEELAREIQDRSGLHPEISKTIADSLNERIFKSVRIDLDKAYAPAPIEPTKVLEELGVRPEPLLETPKIIEEIKKPIEVWRPEAKKEVLSAPSVPAPLRISVVAPTPIPPVTTAKPEEVTQQPTSIPSVSVAGEVPPPPKEEPSLKTTPFLIHKEAEFHPIKEPPKIKTPISGVDLKTVPMPIDTSRPVIAQLEIGKKVEGEESKFARSEISPPRVVHYTDYRTPLPVPEAPRTHADLTRTDADKPSSKPSSVSLQIKPMSGVPPPATLESITPTQKTFMAPPQSPVPAPNQPTPPPPRQTTPPPHIKSFLSATPPLMPPPPPLVPRPAAPAQRPNQDILKPPPQPPKPSRIVNF